MESSPSTFFNGESAGTSEVFPSFGKYSILTNMSGGGQPLDVVKQLHRVCRRYRQYSAESVNPLKTNYSQKKEAIHLVLFTKKKKLPIQYFPIITFYDIQVIECALHSLTWRDTQQNFV